MEGHALSGDESLRGPLPVVLAVARGVLYSERMELLQSANQAQRQAITAEHKPVMIVAGPGTGKTKTLTARIAYVLLQGVSADTILALTFTNKAAGEMSERIRSIIGSAAMPTIATFHALCLAILRKENMPVRFATDTERTQAIQQAKKQADRTGLTTREASLEISRAKGSVQPPLQSKSLVRAYNAILQRQGLIDFDDLILHTYDLLKTQPAVRRRQQETFQHILIDEFQDTSELQWRLVQLLRGSDSVFVIGDPKQSIYGFRGATLDMFAVFRHDFPDYTEVALEVNYRSQPQIVFAANAVFPHDVQLRPHLAATGDACVLLTLNEYSEADAVLQRIEQGVGGTTLLSATATSTDMHFRDFAVVYRTHRAAKVVEQRLRDSGIPFQVVGEGSPYEQAEIQAIIDSFKWLLNRQDTPAIKGFTPGQVRAILEKIAVDDPVSRIAGMIVAALNLAGNDPQKKQHIQQFIGTLVRFDLQGLAQCVAYLTALAQQDFYDPRADAVTLLTIHAAKGLEFTSVMVLAAEEGMLPHIRKSEAPDIEEERRLFYVAITRAKRDLTILYTKKRRGEPAEVSRFVQEIPNKLLPRTVDPNFEKTEQRLYRRQQKARQGTLF